MPRINTRNAYELISELRPFTSNGAISADFDQAGNYVVRSYSTAIAVLYPEENRAVMNEARYSVTTSKHQTQTRIGISRLGYAVTDQDDPAAFEIETGHRARVRGANW
jgi:hypothetical protein